MRHTTATKGPVSRANRKRADRGQQVVTQYCAAYGGDLTDAVRDILADLQHLCHRLPKLDWSTELASAEGHFRAEVDV